LNRREALTRARRLLTGHNIENADLEGEILLRHVLGIDRTLLYSDLDIRIKADDEKALDRLLERRLSGEPSAYITGHREFFGLDFLVDRRVLIPRPETELLVEKAIGLARGRKARTIADIGTGCGAIAVSLAVNLPETTIFAVDISAPALDVARANATRHGVRKMIHFLCGDLAGPVPQPVDMIVANLPYVKSHELSADSPLRFEPLQALDGGMDGMCAIKKMCVQAAGKLAPGGIFLMEIGQGQSADVVGTLNGEAHDSTINVVNDMAGIERVIVFRLTGPEK
jgi:release factor glutamine methyltransferase